MNPEQLLLGFPGYSEQGKRLANYLNIEYREVDIHLSLIHISEPTRPY